MMTDTDITLDLFELDERESNGIRVVLLWVPVTNEVFVLVSDEESGETFAVEVRKTDNPLDVFQHPFAYSALRELESLVS